MLSAPLIEPETIVGCDGVAPVTVQPYSLPDTLVTAVPVEAAVTGGFIEAAVFRNVLHVMVAPDVSNVCAQAGPPTSKPAATRAAALPSNPK